MTSQRYMLWRCNGHLRARCGPDIVKVRWHPGREQQFFRMIAAWEEQDGVAPKPKEAGSHANQEST